MKKLKIYLDTSVISHLQAEDAPEKVSITLGLWTQIQKGFYQAIISGLVLGYGEIEILTPEAIIGEEEYK
jgi:hypothetical protein